MDKNIVTEPTFLDGSVTTEGKGNEAIAQYYNWLRTKQYRFYIPYPNQVITDEDLDLLWRCEPERDFFTNFYLENLRKTNMNEFVKVMDDLSDIIAKVDWEKSNKLLESHLLKARADAKKNNHAGHELGAREFTFTYSPKWCTDEEARDLMRKAISKLIKYYTDEIIQLRAVGEVGSNGLSHVHCFYKLRGGIKITDKNFKRAYKFWNPKKVTSRTGHEGGHHATVRIESDFHGYIDKDVEVAWMDVYYPDADPTA